MFRPLWRRWLALIWIACLAPPAGIAAGRHVTLLADTSGSMRQSDPGRYTLQLSQIIADLLDPADSLTVIRLPTSENGCSDGPNPRLAQPFEAADRSGFRRKLEGFLNYGGNNYFAGPVRTAAADLDRHRDLERLLLFIADSGGLGPCGDILTLELSALRAEGVMIAAVNLGGAGAFDSNPAFEFTIGALDSEQLVNAVAAVYQRFLGTKQVQTGRVGNKIEVTLDPLVREAYLVVAADGALPGIEAGGGNPAAEALDLNHRGGGYTMGLDGRRRDYRIVRLRRPDAGLWRFQVPGLRDPAGWMLLQDSALGLRLRSPPAAAEGLETTVEAELYDQETGQRVTEPSRWPGLEAVMSVDGRNIRLRDDGGEGDRKAGDGLFTARMNFGRAGTHRILLRLQSEAFDRRSLLEIEVEKVAWRLEPQVGPRFEASTPAVLRVRAEPVPGRAPPGPLGAVQVARDGRVVTTLRDDGQAGDAVAGDRQFSGTWTPDAAGEALLEFSSAGGGHALPAQAAVRIVGTVRFGPAIPVTLARTGSNTVAAGALDLGAATTVKGGAQVELGTDFDLAGSALEIDFGRGWEILDAGRRALELQPASPRSWPLRLRVGNCPAGADRSRKFSIIFQGEDFEGRPLRHAIPLSVEIVEDPWLHCVWPYLAMLAGALLTAVLVHGFGSPSRFSPRLGVVLSPEEDMNEGFFYPIGATPGTGSGFYRDARVHICQDFRLAGTPRGALARLRAEGTQVRIRPASGMRLSRRNLDGDWEDLPEEETVARFGTLYRGPAGTLFFELRNG